MCLRIKICIHLFVRTLNFLKKGKIHFTVAYNFHIAQIRGAKNQKWHLQRDYLMKLDQSMHSVE